VERVEPKSLQELDSWLAINGDQKESIWLVLAKQGSGLPVFAKPDVVKTALAHGWIDSLPAKLDAKRYMLRLSPRSPQSNWSGLNKRYIAELEAEGRMTSRGRILVDEAKRSGTWDALNDVEALFVHEDLATAFAKTPGSRETWKSFPDSVKRGQLEQIYTAKRAPTRAKRIDMVVGLAAVGRRAFFEREKS